VAAAAVAVAIGSHAVPAGAATGANFIATGHDMDLHCSGGETNECAYLKIVVDKVRNGSTLPILALDHGSELTDALAAAGEAPVTSVDPDDAAALNAVAFTAAGAPKFSAIITASDSTCGGCDNTTTSIANINARAGDFKTFFNAGGGILALAGADDRGTYYNFVPLPNVTAAAVSPPFTVQPPGATLGVTDAMVNCCATHNSFNNPPAPFVILESDSAGLAETIAAFGASIGGGGFTSVVATKTADKAVALPGATDGYTVTLTNTGTAAAPVTSISDTLPAGFTYVSGSTTGGITTDPAVAAGVLTWSGTFSVPAAGALTFHFGVHASLATGHYTNSVAATDGATAVASVSATAPIDVATTVATPAFPVEGLPIALVLGGGMLFLFWRRRSHPQLARD
jgi:uncharacterized repeat protein (TIGR01451 family)